MWPPPTPPLSRKSSKNTRIFVIHGRFTRVTEYNRSIFTWVIKHIRRKIIKKVVAKCRYISQKICDLKSGSLVANSQWIVYSQWTPGTILHSFNFWNWGWKRKVGKNLGNHEIASPILNTTCSRSIVWVAKEGRFLCVDGDASHTRYWKLCWWYRYFII